MIAIHDVWYCNWRRSSQIFVYQPKGSCISLRRTVLPRRPTLIAVSLPTAAAARWRRYRNPSITSGRTTMVPSASGDVIELQSEDDFCSLYSPDGWISICGFGSLLSERSARSSFPELRDFRMATLQGFRRVFAHVAPIFFERGIANQQTGVLGSAHLLFSPHCAPQPDFLFIYVLSAGASCLFLQEISSLSVEPCEGENLVVTVFDIKKEWVPIFIERENEFRFLRVFLEGLDGVPLSKSAVLCARYSDEEYFNIRCKGSREIYFQRYGKHNVHKIWRDDILPCRIYLRHCVLAARYLGEAAYDSFVDHTYIGDRRTTIREYLATTGSGIMEESPPEELRSRYGG